MQINTINPSFIKSISHISQAIPPQCTEIAMLGRSNVGKSSLINLLLGTKLAKSSSTPGKTRLINFFSATFRLKSDEKILDIPLVLIDFPGFGYAKVDKGTKREWDRNLSEFIAHRSSIKLFCHLIDSRHINLDMDSNISAFLHQCKRADCNIIQIYTKADKLNSKDLAALKNCLVISALRTKEKDLFSLKKAIIEGGLGNDLMSIFSNTD